MFIVFYKVVSLPNFDEYGGWAMDVTLHHTHPEGKALTQKRLRLCIELTSSSACEWMKQGCHPLRRTLKENSQKRFSNKRINMNQWVYYSNQSLAHVIFILSFREPQNIINIHRYSIKTKRFLPSLCRCWAPVDPISPLSSGVWACCHRYPPPNRHVRPGGSNVATPKVLMVHVWDIWMKLIRINTIYIYISIIYIIHYYTLLLPYYYHTITIHLSWKPLWEAKIAQKNALSFLRSWRAQPRGGLHSAPKKLVFQWENS